RLSRFDEATTAYEKAQALGANDPGVFSGLGQIKYGQRQYEQAIPLLTRAIEADMRNSLLYGQLASAQLHTGRNEEAIKVMRRPLPRASRRARIHAASLTSISLADTRGSDRKTKRSRR